MVNIEIKPTRIRKWAYIRKSGNLNTASIAAYLVKQITVRNRETYLQQCLFDAYRHVCYRMCKHLKENPNTDLERFAECYNLITSLMLEDIKNIFGEEAYAQIEKVITFFSVGTYLQIMNKTNKENNGNEEDYIYGVGGDDR